MAKFLIPLIVFMSFGCSTTPSSSGEMAHWSQAFAFQEPVPNGGILVVTRDNGFVGGGCTHVIAIDRKKAGELETGERLAFYVPEGKHVLAAGIDCPFGGDEWVDFR